MFFSAHRLELGGNRVRNAFNKMLWYILSLVFVFLLSVAGLRIWGDSKDSHGNTKLVIALAEHRDWLVRLFVYSGCRLNPSGWKDRTPIIIGVQNVKMLEFLVKHGAPVNVEDQYGCSP